jgi:hypothetical protein
MQKFIKIFLITLLLLICPYFAKASTLYIDPSESQYGPGDSFPIDIKLNNEGHGTILILWGDVLQTCRCRKRDNHPIVYSYELSEEECDILN